VHPQTRVKTLLYKNLFAAGVRPKEEDFDRGYDYGGLNINFSPDARYVAFSYDVSNDGSRELFVMETSGKNRRRLTNNADGLLKIQPNFSPDGKKLLFTKVPRFRELGPGERDARRVSIGVTDIATGTDISPDLPKSTFAPFWSKTGTRLLFSHAPTLPEAFGRDETPIELQTSRIDGQDVRAFDGKWNQFVALDRMSDGRIPRYRGGNRSPVWNKPFGLPYEDLDYNKTTTSIETAFHTTRYRFSPDGQFYVSEVWWPESKTDGTGMIKSESRSGICLFKRDDPAYQRLLVPNATLVQWL
jgi:dipeptidyl aminopeptidase/acylaminoacyl peptidase